MERPHLLERRAIALLLALVALFYWRFVFFGDRFTYLEKPDAAAQVLPWLQMQARAWHDGVFPLWDPGQWGGQPVLGQFQPGAAFPLNWPLFLAPLDGEGFLQLRFVHLHRAVMHLLAALLMFGLCRELGRSRAGALFGGLAFSCLGYVASVEWPQILHGVIWTPAVFWAFHRTFRLRSWTDASFAGVALGLALLGGHPRAPVFLGISIAVFAATAWFSRRSEAPPPRRALGLAALALVAAGLVAAVQILPALEFAEESLRWINLADPVAFDERVPYFVDEGLRMNPVHIFGAVVPKLQDAGDPFVGWLTLSLALFAVLRRRGEWTLGYAALAIGALLFTFGPQTFFHGWIYAFVPFAEKARGAAQAIFLWQFGVAVAASAGFDALLDSPRQTKLLGRVEIALLVFGAFAAAVVLARLIWGPGGSNPFGYHGEFVIFSAFAAWFTAALIAAAGRGSLGGRTVQGAAIALLLLEGGAAHWLSVAERGDPNRSLYLARLDEPAGVLDYLKAVDEPFRFEIVPDGGQVNLGSWHGLEAVDGNLPAILAGPYRLLQEQGWEEGRDLLNTVYTIAKEPTRVNQIEVLRHADGWAVYRNPNAKPRAWFEGDCAEPARVEWLERSSQSSQVAIDAPCPGTLVFAEPHASGWAAQIDGSPVQIHAWQAALRSVAVRSGHSTVRQRYAPTKMFWGAGLSVSGLVLTALLWLLGRRRQV